MVNRKAGETPSSKDAATATGWQQFIQIALPCLKFSPRIALSDDTAKVERELRVLEAAARGTITAECKRLAKDYFYYADWLLGKKRLDPGKDALEYFFRYHNRTPSENLKAIDGQAACRTRIARLIRKDSLTVKDIATGETFNAELSFVPGSSLLANLDRLERLVMMSAKPKLYPLTPAVKERVRKNLQRIDFAIGPWIEPESQYYVSHWNVLSYPLTEEELDKALAFIE